MKIGSLALLTITLVGCSGDRGVSDFVSDTQTDLALKQKIYKFDPDLDFSVNRDIFRGQILLTGCVHNEKEKKKIESFARSLSSVDIVHNHLVIKKREKFFDFTKDSGISREIKTHLLCDTDVVSSNICVRVYDCVVYLMGVAKDEHERQKVLDYATNTQGVKKVVCYLK
jgi:osmotically-inducible protein OsmY